MKIQVKHIVNSNPDMLQHEINEFLKEEKHIEIKDIKYNTIIGQWAVYGVLIVYEE